MNYNFTNLQRNCKVVAFNDTNLIKQNLCKIDQIEIEFAFIVIEN